MSDYIVVKESNPIKAKKGQKDSSSESRIDWNMPANKGSKNIMVKGFRRYPPNWDDDPTPWDGDEDDSGGISEVKEKPKSISEISEHVTPFVAHLMRKHHVNRKRALSIYLGLSIDGVEFMPPELLECNTIYYGLTENYIIYSRVIRDFLMLKYKFTDEELSLDD